MLIHMDSQLVVQQVNDAFEVKDEKFQRYYNVVQHNKAHFTNIQLKQIPYSAWDLLRMSSLGISLFCLGFLGNIPLGASPFGLGFLGNVSLGSIPVLSGFSWERPPGSIPV